MVGARLLSAGLLGLAATAQAAPCPAVVRVSLPNFEIRPYVLGTDKVESPPGLLIEWTRRALARASTPTCKPAIVIQRRPPQRQLAEIESGLLDILPGFSYSDRPGDALVYPMRDGAPDPGLAIMVDTVSLYVRAGETRVRWDGARLASPNPLVGSSAGGAATEATAAQYGFPLESAPTPHADIDKLLAGRIDVIMEPDVVMRTLLKGAAVHKLSPPARQTLRYAPMREGFARAYPQFTARFWREMCVASRAGGSLGACR